MFPKLIEENQSLYENDDIYSIILDVLLYFQISGDVVDAIKIFNDYINNKFKKIINIKG